jgi:hypothetical protein
MPGDAVDHATAGNFAVLSRQMLPNGNLRPCRIARLGQPVVAEVRGQTPPTFVWHVEQAAVMDFPQSASMDSFALSLAQYQFQTAQNLCGTCRDYHALWPYRRLAGMDIGIEASAQRVAAALRASQPGRQDSYCRRGRQHAFSVCPGSGARSRSGDLGRRPLRDAARGAELHGFPVETRRSIVVAAPGADCSFGGMTRAGWPAVPAMRAAYVARRGWSGAMSRRMSGRSRAGPQS